MIKITKAQVDVFREASIECFARAAALQLHATFPRESGAMDGAELHRFVRVGIDDAASHAIVTEHGVLRFLRCMLVRGCELGAGPNRMVLDDPSLEECEKLDMLEYGP